jgi:hypothetical protein
MKNGKLIKMMSGGDVEMITLGLTALASRKNMDDKRMMKIISKCPVPLGMRAIILFDKKCLYALSALEKEWNLYQHPGDDIIDLFDVIFDARLVRTPLDETKLISSFHGIKLIEIPR